jgi:hypothetical protein
MQGGIATYDDYNDNDECEPLTVPGANLLGSQFLYPFDLIAQSEDVFPCPPTAPLTSSYQLRPCSPKSLLPRLGRIFGMAILFIACLACPFLIPVVYLIRRFGQR